MTVARTHVLVSESEAEASSHRLVDVSGLVGESGLASSGPATTVRFWYDELAFHAAFEADAEPPILALQEGGGEVFRDDCVELFLAFPREPTRYVEVVVNAAGAIYAADVLNPDDSRVTWQVTRIPPPDGLVVTTSCSPDAEAPRDARRWGCRISLPWTAFGAPGPRPREERRGNAYRIARGRSTAFLALSPTLRGAPPDFHVPSRFTRFEFL